MRGSFYVLIHIFLLEDYLPVCISLCIRYRCFSMLHSGGSTYDPAGRGAWSIERIILPAQLSLKEEVQLDETV